MEMTLNYHLLVLFQLNIKKSRIGRNPKTGVEATISARRVVTFHPSNLIRKKKLNENE